MHQTAHCETHEIQSWADFDGATRKIRLQDKPARDHGLRPPELLFRGVGNSVWGLETTLERSYPLERCDETSSVRKYYRRTNTAKPAIETLSGRRFEKLPTIPEFDQLIRDNPWRMARHDPHAAIRNLRVPRLPSPSRISLPAPRLDCVAICSSLFRLRFATKRGDVGERLRTIEGLRTKWLLRRAHVGCRAIYGHTSEASSSTMPIFDVRRGGRCE